MKSIATSKLLPIVNFAGIIVTALTIVFISPSAGALDFHGVSITSDMDAAGTKRTINVVIDENELLDSYDFWKGNGLRRETTETFFRSHPYSMGAAFALNSAKAALHGRGRIFEGFPVTVIGSMIEVDDYGHAEKHEILSFTLTADLDAKIDWDHFNGEAFQKVASDFRFTEWFKQKFREEPLH
jgi:hypothetical protein